jgi:hypothetical protein
MNQSVAVSRRKAASQLEGKTYGSQKEVKSPWTYYDTYILAAAAGKVTLFNNSVSRAEDLSNYQYQQIPQGQAFDIMAMQLQYIGSALKTDVMLNNLVLWMNQAVIEVVVANKTPTFQSNLALALGGAMFLRTAPAVTVNSGFMSNYNANGIIPFQKKIYLDQGTKFTVDIKQTIANDAGLTGDKLRVGLIGKLVQLS